MNGFEQRDATTDSWTVKQDDLVRYAAASRDFNKIHYESDAAQAFGFERPIAHGMLNLGIVLTRVADIVGVASIRSSRTRFNAPAYVGSRLTLAFVRTRTALAATITDKAGAKVLTSQIALGEPDHGGNCHENPDGEVVAERVLVVEQGPATRFAHALGAGSASFLRADAARAAGFSSIPVVPSYAFALPGWGFFPEFEGNEAATIPDAVLDCQAWARTTGPVVHAAQSFTYARPMFVGETVRSRTVVVGRATKQRGERTLHFTDVHSVFTDSEGGHILTSGTTLVVSV